MDSSDNVVTLYPSDLDGDFDTHLASLGFGVNPSGIHRQYRQEALRLNTLSDRDLSLIGLTRRDIPAYVMRHRFTAFAQRFSMATAKG